MKSKHNCSGDEVHFVNNFTAFAFQFVNTLQRAYIGDHTSLLNGGLPCASADGLWLEFGVWKGTSARLIADYCMARNLTLPALFAFDSFLGLPENWRDVWKLGRTGRRRAASLTRGTFALAGVPPKLPERYDAAIEWVVGWFNESLPRFLHAHPDKHVSFLHVDSDLYSSATTQLKLLRPRLKHGTILVFDEFFNYPEYLDHEILALWEFLRDDRKLSVQVIATSTRKIEWQPQVETFKQSCALKLIRK